MPCNSTFSYDIVIIDIQFTTTQHILRGYIMRASDKYFVKQHKLNSGGMWLFCLLVVAIFVSSACSANTVADRADESSHGKLQAKVTGLRYNNVHVLELEKTMKLYREILGFELVDAEVLKGNLAGMLVLKMKANDYMMTLTVTPPQHAHNLAPVGNTNHNHFMLKVNDIATIGDKLKEHGYELENEHYARDLYTFFVGPNGEIIGLSAWED
ncbi:VOC family protein [Paraglaciecola aquimarina]|uniref:VOC family protein n=1 Tax=Paraglaciecola aquimarina TaxID=1235557 RepID=A0ABU3SVM1_9ALTE|nr:VOC family protein [Paraglaciecola aquimarina]MDU0354070.1 VOC family protein [Paraglaciecola aquimarina]